MRELFLALPVLLLMAGSACKKVDQLTEFDISYTSTQSVPGSSLSIGGPVDFISPDIETQSTSKFSANGTTKDLVDEVKITKFTVTNETGNLDFIKSFSVFMRADGLPEVLVASRASIPAGVSSVDADIAGSNIKEHIFKDKIQLRFSVVVNSLPADEQKLRIDQTMRVKGKRLSK